MRPPTTLRQARTQAACSPARGPARGRSHARQPPRRRVAARAADPDPSSPRPDRDAGLGLKAAWLGAEALGDVVGALKSGDASQAPDGQTINTPSTGPLPRDAALASIRADYDDVYFVSGKGSLAAYDDDCEFADPFASFRGKARFIKNVSNLGGLLEDVKLDLKSFEPGDDALVTEWTFSGILAVFPWRPRLAASGVTTHTFSPTTGRVCRHYEDWKTAPGDVLRGLLKPSARVPTGRWDVFADSLHRGAFAAAYRAAAPALAAGAAINAAIARLASGGAVPGPGEWLLWVGVAAAAVAAVQEVLPRAK